ncbi:MAG: pyridoxine 5'-phosphate synthase [Methyloceanibacter sp.]
MTSNTAKKTARRDASVPPIRLGINIDHIATLRNARGGRHPDPLRAAMIAVEAGADNITAHLREDRRHITDSDIMRLADALPVPLNLEMAATPEMLGIALKTSPHAVCLVPEKRTERTTEGGLDVDAKHNLLVPYVSELVDAGIRVSVFIAPERCQIEAAARVRAPVIEIHVGPWCEALAEGHEQEAEAEWRRICDSARIAHDLGLEVHAGHGLNYATAETIAGLPQIVELNIGHYLVGEAVFVGLSESVSRMRAVMDGAREALRHSATQAKVGGA